MRSAGPWNQVGATEAATRIREGQSTNSTPVSSKTDREGVRMIFYIRGRVSPLAGVGTLAFVARILENRSRTGKMAVRRMAF